MWVSGQTKGKADADTLDFFAAAARQAGIPVRHRRRRQCAPTSKRSLPPPRKALDGNNTVIGSFMCQGKMPVSVRQRYEAMKAKATLHIPNLDALIENFDKALSPPGRRRSGTAETGRKVKKERPHIVFVRPLFSV